MLWSDPWVQIASAGKTRIPVPTPRLPPGVTFVMQNKVDEAWLGLIGDHIKTNAVSGCLIPCLYQDDVLVATCIFRPHHRPQIYALETLVARPRGHGYGGHLLHAAVHYMGPNAGYVYVWELSLAGLIGSWLKGWLASMVRLEYGWIHAGNHKATKTPYIESGLGDGYIYMFEPDREILDVPQKAWTAAKKCPGPGWSWTGEFVITGNLNLGEPVYRWFTQEITPRPSHPGTDAGAAGSE
jgi:hypothetical protein